MWPLLLLTVLVAAAAASQTPDLGAGEVCASGGRCVEEGGCDTPLGPCGADGNRKGVCCPANKREAVSKAEQKCKEYNKFAYEDSPVLLITKQKVLRCYQEATKLVVGGTDAKPYEFPHMVNLGYGEMKSGRVALWGCGGSLISEDFVLTAAHCVNPPNANSLVRWANVGDLNVRSTNDGVRNQIVEVVERHVHPGYTKDRKYDDIALLRLAKRLAFSPALRPACLMTRRNFSGEYVVTGWGRTGNKFLERSSDVLQKVKLNPVDSGDCKTFFGTSSQLPDGISSDTQLCAGGVPGKDSCKGDSGGPIQINLNDHVCMYAIVGITSFGPPQCGEGSPGVYTRVSHYVPWIESKVWPS